MKIAILAPFSSFHDSYSLAHVVCESVRGLLAAGHEVECWCFTSVNPANDPPCRGIEATFRPCIRPHKFVRDTTCPSRYRVYAEDIQKAADLFQPDAIITHDALFQGDYIDIARAIHLVPTVNEACAKADWFHWVHSAVPKRDAQTPPYGCDRYRRSLPMDHKIIYPNTSCADDVAGYYQTHADNVLYCPNPHDARAQFGLSPEATMIVERGNLLAADVVQVYPLCATRWAAKGGPHLLRIFKAMKDQGNKVRLVLAMANFTDPALQSQITGEIAALGMTDDVVIPGLIDARFANGLPHSVVMELQRIADVFVFPTIGEACPLILIEAMMSGCLIVANQLVPCLREYVGNWGLHFLLPPVENIDTYTVKTTTEGAEPVILTGEPAYARAIEEVSVRILQTLVNSRSYHGRKDAFRRFGREVVAQKLVALLSA